MVKVRIKPQTNKERPMTQRITLSIPDMLHEKMEKWRQSFNLSKMFQEALAEAIHKKEEFQKRFQQESDIPEIIERLRAEKLQSEGNYSENGRAEGLQWARSAHYEDLIYAASLDVSHDIAQDQRLGTYFTELMDDSLFRGKSPGELEKYTNLFFDGWRRGVAEFWDEIKEKL